MTTWTGWPAACRPQTTVPSWFDTALVVGIVDAVGGRQGGGGGEKARGSPGRGEEDKYQGWKVQGGGGGRGSAQAGGRGGRKRRRPGQERGPGGGGRARARRATATSVDRTTARRMPLRRVSERGVSPPAPRQSLRTRGRRWLERWVLEVEE